MDNFTVEFLLGIVNKDLIYQKVAMLIFQIRTIAHRVNEIDRGLVRIRELWSAVRMPVSGLVVIR